MNYPGMGEWSGAPPLAPARDATTFCGDGLSRGRVVWRPAPGIRKGCHYISNKRPARCVILSPFASLRVNSAKDLGPARDPSLRSGWHACIGFVWRAHRLLWRNGLGASHAPTIHGRGRPLERRGGM